jgi:DNA (cytosine-5)-methyltransferase 1
MMATNPGDISVTDLFCGAGGSSIGAQAAGGRLVMAANHWKLAIETHQGNFPDADHDCSDVSQVRPQRYPSTDMLIASPECTNHSLAKGKRRGAQRGQMGLVGIEPEEPEEVERSRATMWDVPRFAEFHRYRMVIVENVVDARDWVMYPAWLSAMTALGYEHHAACLNSMFVQSGDWGAPQSRDRLYVVFWRKGMRSPELDYRPPSWCYRCERDVAGIQTWKRADRRWGRYRQQYVYTCHECRRQVAPYVYPAARAIDWTIVGQRIGDRTRPLAEPTMARIRQGIAKYWGRDLVVPLDRLRESKIPLPIEMPMQTATARQDKALVNVPFIAEMHGTSGARTVGEPLLGVTASGNHHGLCEPPLTPTGRPTDLLMPYHRTAQAHPVDIPMSTLTTHDRQAMVGAVPEIEDCTFRMLEPHEIGAAMAFPESYDVKGNKRQRVRQYGNAVTPPVMQWLVQQGADSLR